jgi:DNA gyrase subunit B
MSNKENEYDASSIQVLKGLAAVRRRPGMYIGDVYDGSGLHNMVFVLVEHTVEEREKRGGDEIAVTLNADGAVTFEDNSVGLPMEIDHREGVPRAELIMTLMMSGGGDYWCFPIVNALSSRLDISLWSEGFEYAASFADGEITSPFSVVNSGRQKTGLRITFWPSPVIFPKTTFDYAVLRHRLRELAILHPGVRIVLTELRKSNPYFEEMIYERHT